MSTVTGSSGNVFTSSSATRSLEERLAAMRAAANGQKTTSNGQKATGNGQKTASTPAAGSTDSSGNTFTSSRTTRSLEERLAAMRAAANAQKTASTQSLPGLIAASAARQAASGGQSKTKPVTLPTGLEPARVLDGASLKDAARLASDNLSQSELLSASDRLRSVENGIKDLEQELAGYQVPWDVSPYTEEEQAYRDARASGLEHQLEQLRNRKAQLLNEYYIHENEEKRTSLQANEEMYSQYSSAQSLQEDMDKITAVAADTVTHDGGAEIQEYKDYLEQKYGLTQEAINNYVIGGAQFRPAGDGYTNLWQLYEELSSQKEQAVTALSDAGYDYERMTGYGQRLKDAETYAQKQAEWQQYARQHPVLSSIDTVLASPFQGIDYLKTMGAGIGHSNESDLSTYVPMNVYNMDTTNFVSTVRETVSEDIAEKTNWNLFGQNVAAFLYQTGMSVADSAVQVAAFGSAATLFMGASAASNQAKDVIERGGTNNQAFWSGLAAGAAEVVFEKISIENLLSEKSVSSIRDLLRETVKQAGVEASEEMLTEIANILSDAAIMGQNSDYANAVAQYQAQGMTKEEAEKQAFLDCIGQVMWAGAGGALSGGIMEGGLGGLNYGGYAAGQLSSRLQNNQADTAINQAYQAMLDKGMFSQEAGAAGSQAADILAATRETDDAWAPVRAQMEAAPETEQTAPAADGGLELPHVQNENRTIPLPKTIGFQMPIELQRSDSTDSITQGESSVNSTDGRLERPSERQTDAERMNKNGQQGNDLSDGGQRRVPGAGTGEQTGSLVQGTSGRGQTAQQSRTAIERQNRVRDLQVEKVSSQSLGIRNGTDTAALTVVPESAWDDGIRQTSQRVREETGKAATFVVGGIQVSTADGVRMVRGVYSQDGIIIQADNLRYTTDQIADHEIYHDRSFQTPGMNWGIEQSIQARFGQDEFGQTVEKYIKNLRGVLDTESLAETDGAALDQLLEAVKEEIFADAYAGINAFSANAPKYADTVNEVMNERGVGRNRQSDAATARRTGPPESIGTDSHLQGKQSRDTIDTAKYSLEEELQDGRAREEDREAFLRRIDSEGLTGFEGDAIAYGYRDVQGSGSSSAKQIQEELTHLGIDCAVMDGSLSWNLNGITGQRSVTEATAVEGKRVLINGNTTIAAKNAAGHEAFHFWKNTPARDAYIEILEDNLDYTSEAFLTYQSAIAEAYLGGEANLSDSGQYKKLREELFAYISGDIYEGTNDEYLRPMFRNFDEVKAAWGSMVDTAKAADGRLELPNVWADGQNNAAENNSEFTGKLELPYVDNSDLDRRQRFSVEDEPDTQFQRVEPLGQENEGQDADWADYTQEEVRELTGRGYTSAKDYMMRAPDADREAGKVRAVRKSGESALQDFDSVDDYTRYLDERAAQAKEARLRQIPKEEFAGSESLEKLGIRIEHSVGDYGQVKQLIANDKAARQIRKETGRARKRLGATRAEENFASGIAEGIYTVDDIPATMNRDAVEELADYYFAERAAGQDLIREKRKTINAVIDEKVQDIFKDSDKFKVPSGLVLNNRTAQRNMRSIFGAERGSEINSYLFDPVQVNEAERLRFVNRMYDEVREFEGKDGRKKALNKTERELVQKVIEGQVNVNEQLKGEKVDEVRVRNAAAKYSELFDQFYDAINDFLVAHGYEPIGYIKGYAPHLQPEGSQSALTKALQAMGIGTDVTTLPSSIAGLTAEYKPSKKWNPYFLTRTGAETQYDIAAAFESYVDYMSDVIYHTDDIMRLRRAAGYFRKTYAPDDIRSKIEWAEDQRMGTTEQKESVLRTNDRIGNDSLLSAKDIDQELDKYIDELYRDTENVTKYSNLVMYLDNYTNILAGKQNMMDRGWETGVGRKVLNLGNKIMSVFGQAQIAGNLSSAINQISQLPMVQAEVGTRYVLQAATDIAFGKTKKADWANEVDFLVGKQGVDLLVNDKLSDKIIEGMFKPVEIADQLMSTVTVRAKYLQQISQGKTHQEAIKAADAFGRSIMGDRTKGARPVAFTAKNPLSRMLRVFQLEALNTVEHFTQDLPNEIIAIKTSQGAREAAKRLAAIVIRYLLAAFLLNRITEQINGSTPATFDIIGLGTGFAASGKGMTTNNLLATMIDNGLEDLGAERIFGTDADSLSGGFDLKSALEETGYNVSNDIPFVRNAAGIMGWGDESLPTLDLPGIAESARGIPEAIVDGDGWGVADGIIGVLSQLLPGGRQLQKTYNGLRLEAAGGSYNASGNLKYPVDGNAMEILQAALFGSSALEETDEYYASGNSALNKTQTELYKNLVDEGMDRKDAFEMVSSIRDLKPEEGADSVTNLQRMWEIAESPYGEDVQELALKTVMSESAYTRYMAARNAGVGTLDYVKVYEAICNATMERRGSSGSPSQADVETALNKSGLTNKQKKAIWNSYGWKSESPWG